MKKVFASAALLVCAAAPAQPFPPVDHNGQAYLYFRPVNGRCMPQSLATELSESGATVYQDKQDGKVCCPSAARHVSPRTIDQSIWRRIQPFAAPRGAEAMSPDELCRMEAMSDEEGEKLRAQVEATHQAAQKKQEDERRPIPASWAALKQSPHPADGALAKSIESMKWWDACVAWGREARAKTMSRRGTALQQYLQSDRTINATDLGSVRSGRPVVGQTSCGAFAALGLPSKSNTTESSKTVRIQYVYRDKGIYVYVTGTPNDHNGLVTSIQY